MKKEVDARGLACPKPVVLAKKALQDIDAGVLTVLVDNTPAVENVSRFAKSAGCDAVTTECAENDFAIRITKEKSAVGDSKGENPRKTVVFLNTDKLGQGEPELGELLAKAFTYALTEVDNKPQVLILMNKGVTLAVEGSDSLENLIVLGQQSGVKVMVCGTCLDYYGLTEKLKVGINSNMYDIAEEFLAADNVITL